MSRFTLFVTSFLLCLADASWASAQVPGPGTEIKERPIEQLRLRAEAHGENSSYRVDIYEPSDDDNGDRLVEIRCVSACRHDRIFRELVDGVPIAAFTLNYDGRFLITTWGIGASSSGARIYFVSDEEIRMVLDIGGRGWPKFAIGPDGAPKVTMTHYQPPISKKSRTTQEFWSWNGHEYKRTGRKCVANCSGDPRAR